MSVSQDKLIALIRLDEYVEVSEIPAKLTKMNDFLFHHRDSHRPIVDISVRVTFSFKVVLKLFIFAIRSHLV